jgi:lipopolysaccharide biosynthesis glycosyltransferase
MTSFPIVTAADQRYFPGLLATVFTLFASSTNCDQFKLHVFDGGLSAGSKRKLEQLVIHFGNDRGITWLHPDVDDFDGLVSMHGNYLEYARLALPSLLHEPRICWLDSDLLVLGDCGLLARIDLGDSLASAALEAGEFASDVDNMAELGIPANAPYFNSGVMVMDLDCLRAFDFTAKAVDYLKKNAGRYRFWDQSAINVVLLDRIAQLPRQWNYVNRLFLKSPNPEMVEQGGYIYHFLERPKPWQRYSGEPHAQILYGIMELLDEPMPELDGPVNRVQRLKWRYPSLAATYYACNPKRLTQPREMQMCRDTWRQAARIKHVSDTKCAEVALAKLRNAYSSTTSKQFNREGAVT